jgi:hypothetical protein
MGSRLGHDFSDVRVHTDREAVQSAKAVNAHAFTVGRDVVFDAGEYSPRTPTGSALLAHELTHVMQQSHGSPGGTVLRIAPSSDAAEHQAEAVSRLVDSNVRTQTDGAVSFANGPTLQRQGKPGTATIEERPGQTRSLQPGVTEGTVERREIGDKGALIGRAVTSTIRFDENACKVTVPVKVAYREAAGTDLTTYVATGEKATPYPSTQGREIFRKYIAETNDKLNGWFGVRLENCAGAKCADKLIPIEVEVREDDRNPDYTVSAVNARGRSYVQQKQTPSDVGHVVLVSRSFSDEPYTMAHEGAHMTLAAPDEYAEQGTPPERVFDDDLSLLSRANEFQDWSELHERHFAFVPALLKSFVKSPGGEPCDATLETSRKPSHLDLQVTAAYGFSSGLGGRGIYAGAGLNLGYSFRSRHNRLSLGPHAAYVLGDFNHKSSYLLGLRVGAERRLKPGSVGVELGGYLEVGGASYGKYAGPRETNPYAEAGATFALRGRSLSAFVEAAAGTTVNPYDPQNQKWFRLGVGAGWEF